MLSTSAFRLSATALGDLWVYPIPPRFKQELELLGKKWRARDDRASAPHASLANALSAVTGRPVLILPRTKRGPLLLVTTMVIDPMILNIAVRRWEALCREEDRNALAPLLSEITPEQWPISAALSHERPGRVSAEPWVYRVLGWIVAQRLASKPVSFDSLQVPFRLDSNGGLVAWDTPIVKPGPKSGQSRALMKITPHIKTMPGVGDLVCNLEVSITRLVDKFFDVKSLWLDHGRDFDGSALLRLHVNRVKVGSEWETRFSDFSADVVAACGLSPLPWHQEILRDEPDLVRAWRSTTAEHPIGTGAGPRTYLRLLEHAESVLGVPPVSYSVFTGPGTGRAPVKVRVLNKADGLRIKAGSLDAAVLAAGYGRVRIVNLSATSVSRARVRSELACYQPEGSAELRPARGVVQNLTPMVEFVAYDLADLLAHGKNDRTELLSRAPLLKADQSTLVLALIETVHDGRTTEKDDAKYPLRRALAELTVASQFLATPPHITESDSVEPDGSRDYPVEAAIRDLIMRCGGLVDDRLTKSVTLTPFALDQSAWLVGAHVRRHTPRTHANGVKPQLVSVVTALHATPDQGRPWTIHIYVPGQGWLSHAEGLAAFHRGPLGPEMTNWETAYGNLRVLVDQALGDLPRLDSEPVAVMVCGEASRTVWGGLADLRLGDGPLPGDGLANAAEISIVRITADDAEAPRPVHRVTGGSRPDDTRQPATPGNVVYMHTGDDGTRSWMLGKASKTYSASAKGRCGATWTRLTLPAKEQSLQGKPWHSFTGTEIVIARLGLFEENVLAALTVRLCAQPVSWDGQTRWPVPLHLSRIADEDHPARAKEVEATEQ